MKHPLWAGSNRSWFWLAWLFAILMTSLCARSGAAADWNVAYLNRVLGSVPPGERLVKMGDMQILVRNLKAWRAELAGEPSPNLAFDGAAPTWTGGNVYYTFDGSVSAFNQKVFLDAASEWATFVNVHFIPRATQANYMTVRENPSLSGGQSAVGMVGGQQFLDIGPGAWSRATICHELGHTLGLVHEHQRSDRDAFVAILTNNIVPGEEGNFVKLANSNNQGAYDFLSVMHYGRNAFSTSPDQNTIEPLAPYLNFIDIMGVRDDPVLSPLDRAGVKAVYGPAALPLTSVVTNTSDSGPGTLRAAIYYALDHPGTTITFELQTSDPAYSNRVFNIRLTDALPSLGSSTTLNGLNAPTNTNPDGPSILLDGEMTQTPSVFADGLRFRGSNSVASSLIINSFSGNGVLIDGQDATGNAIHGCYVGLDATGSNAAPNEFPSLTIQNGAHDNVIGGTLPGDRNVFDASPYQGIAISGGGTTGNLLEGNFIGLNANGTATVPNTWAGVSIYGGAQSNIIGGPLASMRNVISGNSQQGIAISDVGTSGNVVRGNYIGLNPAGDAAIPNGWAGVDVFGGPSGTRIGGSNPGEGNIISGNTYQGIVLREPGTTGNFIQGNSIGLNAEGATAIPNGWAGVELSEGASTTLIGGTTPGSRNVISGNTDQGIVMSGTGTRENLVQGNYIGLNRAGDAALGNGWAGIVIAGAAQSNQIGGITAASRNVISGNANQGVAIFDTNTTQNVVQGNYVGVNPSGTAALPNAWAGVELSGGASSNLVGGAIPGAGNLLSGNLLQGIAISFPGTSGNEIEGNLIGLDSSGRFAIANGYSGIEMFNGASRNIVGGGIGGRNIISGNAMNGVQIDGAGTDGNLIQGNTIGYDRAGFSPDPNGGAGISMFGGARSNQIGGVFFGAANLIAGNRWDGVQLFDPGTSNNLVRANSIFGNAGASLVLYSSANATVSAPDLAVAKVTTNTSIGATLMGQPLATYTLDFYANPPSTATAGARVWMGSTNEPMNAAGEISFAVAFPSVLVGSKITATATDPSGNTSSLSSPVSVSGDDFFGSDGIPNLWRAHYFPGAGQTTNIQSCATCDADHDGLDNMGEFLAGTNPTNAASTLLLNAPARAGSNVVLSFQSVPGITYRIEKRDDLSTDAWSILVDQILGPGPTTQVSDPNALATEPRRFYRLAVVQ